MRYKKMMTEITVYREQRGWAVLRERGELCERDFLWALPSAWNKLQRQR